MRFIEEIIVDEFLPTVRSMLAEALRSRGLTQREVADALGISQSAVSKYAHGEVERNQTVLRDDRVQGLVEEIAAGLASGEMTQVQALIELEVFIRQLERGGLLAQLHEQAMPAISGRTSAFSIHDPEGELRTAEQVRASVRQGVRTLENTRGVTGLIPNVGSNIVECLPDAQGIEDVAGVPGRLFEVRGRLSVPADPEFGASEHVATILLAARAAGTNARGAVNVRYTPELIDRLTVQGSTPGAFEAEYDDINEAIQNAVTDDVDVLYQTGGFGIEPIIYILAPSAEAAADRVRALARDE